MGQMDQRDFLNVGGQSWEKLATDEHLIHMGHNCNHLPLEPAITEAMIAAVRDEAWRNYTPPYGFEELQSLIRANVGVADADVFVTQGSTDAIYQFMTAILSPGDAMITTDPAWPHIGNFGRSMGAEVTAIPIYDRAVGFKLAPERMREAITDKTKLIAIIDPLNPVGSSYSEAEIQAICRIAAERGIYVLHDSTYMHFAGVQYFPAIRYYDRAAVTVSLSKTAGFAGLRVGALLTPASISSAITNKHVSRLGGNWIAQQGAIAAYRTMDAWLPRLLATNREHQQMLNACVEAAPGAEAMVYPSAGNFLAIDVTGTGHGAEEIVSAMLAHGIVIRSGNYTSPRFGNDFIRATTTVPKEHISAFVEAFPRALAELS